MSWLAGIAGKAEQLLNKVDQAAATSLNNSGTDDQAPNVGPPPSNFSHTADYAKTQEQSTLGSSVSVPSNLSDLNSSKKYLSQMSRPSLTGLSTIDSKPKSLQSKDKDDELFDFLNSTETVPDDNKKGVNNGKGKSNAVRSNPHSRQSSVSSVSSRGRKTPESNSHSDNSSMGITVAAPAVSSDTIEGGSDSEVRLQEPSSGYHSNTEEGAMQQMSSLELENNLLKNEVASLNQEMASIIQRAKSSQEEMVAVKQRLNMHNSSQAHSDQIIRELQARENDLTEALTAKDSQIGVLRVRYEEVDKQLQAKDKTLAELQDEKNRVLQDHTTSSDVHSQALDTLKDKLREAEEMLRREKERSTSVEKESMQRQENYHSEQKNLAESLTVMQRKLTEEKNKNKDQLGQLKAAKAQAESAKTELNDYKEKAARILQSKDRLINTLKEGNTEDTGEVNSALYSELEQYKQERDMYREELQQYRESNEALRADIQNLEIQMQTEEDTASASIAELEEQLASEKQKNDDAEQENRKLTHEVKYAHEELVKQKSDYKNRLKDRDADIERLRQQLTTKSFSTTSQAELENRLHALTESLIHKQTMLEALSTEKNSLGLQLERMEQQYKEAQVSTSRLNATHVRMSADDDEVRQRMPAFMNESPLDGDVARRVKRYANTIDKFSMRLGVFLRRYPIARLFVIFYMGLLHLWVMIVLLTYKPEMHTPDYMPGPPGHH